MMDNSGFRVGDAKKEEIRTGEISECKAGLNAYGGQQEYRVNYWEA